MNPGISDLKGFQPLSFDKVIEWNTNFNTVYDLLKKKSVYKLESQGKQLVRFEEDISCGLGIQNHLHFKPEYNYGLRAATLYIEAINGRTDLRDQDESYRPLVRGYLQMLEELERRYGSATLLGFKKEDEDKITKMIDIKRDQKTLIASWDGEYTKISHELNTAAPNQKLFISAVGVELVIRNCAGDNDLFVLLEFPGGSANVSSWASKEYHIDLPHECQYEVEVVLGKSEIRGKFTLARHPVTLEVHRNWLTGKLSLKEGK